METYERRTQIWEKLRVRRKDTISNLANEFGVSKQTIRRDIDTLSREHNIYTLPGRYCGGVFVGDNVERGKYLTESEIDVLTKIYQYITNETISILTDEEANTLYKLITTHRNPSSKKDVHKNK